MQLVDFQQFNLVGGTSLSLQIGHRMSIDLDLFSYQPYESQRLITALQSIGRLEILVDKPPFLQVRLDDVKLDFLTYPYEFVQEFVEMEGVRLVPIQHIALMKLLAVARRGVKKDFIDLYFLLEKFEMAAIIQLFQQKMPQIDLFHIFKSLTYFVDAELDADPKLFVKMTWKAMKKSITKKVTAFLKNYKPT